MIRSGAGATRSGLEQRLRRPAAETFRDLAPGSLVLVATSAGADSTALAELLARALPPLGLRLAALHLDHRLRPDSAADRAFVERLAERLEVACHAGETDVRSLARERGLGLEEAGRAARGAFFEQVAARTGAAAVALGHTLEDRAETLLLNLLRGAGSSGLASMRARQGPLLRRPLLGVRRAALRELLRELGVGFREDPSNADRRFLRNRVRHEILPLLASLNPRIHETLARTAALLEEEDAYLDRLSESQGLGAIASLASPIARRVALRELRALCGHHPELGHRHVDALLGLARDGRGAHATDLPGGLRLSRDRRSGRVRVAPREPAEGA